MCLSPIHIRKSANGKVAFDVPCGKCEACKQNRSDMYSFRAWQEFVGSGGRAIFATLTYDDEHLPHCIAEPAHPVWSFDDDKLWEFDVNTQSYFPTWQDNLVSCWDKSHCKKFFKQLKEQLKYYIATDVLNISRVKQIKGRQVITDEWKSAISNIVPIKYLLTCERGSDRLYRDDHGILRRATSRPHYHAIIVISDPRLDIDTVASYINKLWIYGNTENLLIDRTVIQAIQYVCKYITKDFGDSLLSSVGSLSKNKIDNNPFTLQSNFFGSYYYTNSETLDELYQKLEFSALNGVNLPPAGEEQSSRVVQLPRYYLNRWCHDVKRMQAECSWDDYLKCNFKDELLLDNGFCPTIITANDILSIQHDDTFLYTGTKSTLNEFGSRLDSIFHQTKVNFYTTQLSNVQTGLLSENYLSDFISPKQIQFLKEVDLESFKLYVRDDHYITYDQYFEPTIFTDALFTIQTFLRNVKKADIYKRDLEYKSNIYKARQKNPGKFKKHRLESKKQVKLRSYEKRKVS